MHFAAKTASQHMAQPKVCDWPKIKRIASYFINSVQKFAWHEKTMHITTFVDSDWAGNKMTRRSTCAARCSETGI